LPPSDDRILGKLNEHQLEAVLQTEGPLLVLAGAGSGKTRVITRRCAWLLQQGVAPENILAVTFTNKAAGEMKERIRGLVDAEAASQVLICTFHALGLRILRKEATSIGMDRKWSVIDDEDRQSLVRQVVLEAGGGQGNVGEDFGDFVDLVKGRGMEPMEAAQAAGPMKGKQLLRCFRAYQNRLELMHCWDFDDLLWLPKRILAENPAILEKYATRFRYIMVDEYQDTNLLQLRFLKQLASVHGNICVVGDDDQSIYGWRGARVENILEFDKHFPGAKTIKLTRNYRSQGAILSMANQLIRNNTKRKDKDLWTEAGLEVSIHRAEFPTPEVEADWVAAHIANKVSAGESPGEVAVLYRTKSQAQRFEQALALRRVPFRVMGSFDFFKRKEIRDCLAYFRLLANPRDNGALSRILNQPDRHLRSAEIEAASKLCTEQRLPLLEALLALAEQGALNPRAASEVKKLRTSLDQQAAALEQARRGAIGDVLDQWIGLSGYLKTLPVEAEGLRRNVDSLMESVRRTFERGDCESLGEMLERLALDGSERLGEGKDEGKEGVSLITLHAAKGLEFNRVYICGLVDGLLPHFHSTQTRAGIEEERRLLYVGITRARQDLILCGFRTRRTKGVNEPCKPSRFIEELPAELLEVEGTPSAPQPDPEQDKLWKSLLDLVKG
jgi:DNA helicase-2/ATP-dependent DNA helicase PcrA